MTNKNVHPLYPHWSGKGCPSKSCRELMTKIEIINRAIEKGDCILLDKETVVPWELNNKRLCYYDQNMKQLMCNIDNVEVEECE